MSHRLCPIMKDISGRRTAFGWNCHLSGSVPTAWMRSSQNELPMCLTPHLLSVCASTPDVGMVCCLQGQQGSQPLQNHSATQAFLSPISWIHPPHSLPFCAVASPALSPAASPSSQAAGPSAVPSASPSQPGTVACVCHQRCQIIRVVV